MVNKDTYKLYCNRLIAYASDRMTVSKLIIVKYGDHYSLYICLKDPAKVGLSLLVEAFTYKEMCYKIVTLSQCSPFNKDMSLEEMDLQLQIRGY